MANVHHDGHLVINFPERFKVPDDWSSINSRKRRLFEQSELELKVEPLENQTEDDVSFLWSIEEFTSTEMKILLKFDNPFEINSQE